MLKASRILLLIIISFLLSILSPRTDFMLYKIGPAMESWAEMPQYYEEASYSDKKLADIAIALAKRGKFEEAIETAMTIEDNELRGVTLGAISSYKHDPKLFNKAMGEYFKGRK